MSFKISDKLLIILSRNNKDFSTKQNIENISKKISKASPITKEECLYLLKQVCLKELYLIKIKVDTKSLSDQTIKELELLLDGVVISTDFFSYPSSAFDFVITPRLGTISPRSTKATSLLKICNFEFLERIEIVSLYSVDYIKGVCSSILPKLNLSTKKLIIENLFLDKMTQNYFILDELNKNNIFEVFAEKEQKVIRHISTNTDEINKENQNLGLCLTEEEIKYIIENKAVNISDVELMMFSQLNSEHCRHKHFNATCIINNKPMDFTMFQLIKKTHQKVSHKNVKSAYKDNAAVINGAQVKSFKPQPDGVYKEDHRNTTTSMIIKVETHNHPTGVSPYEGAATGVGGEIRDEGAVGTGSLPKCGISGYIVSDLNIPGNKKAWEILNPEILETNLKLASPLDIMIEGPLGACNYSNEFGRPNIAGFFRTVTIKSNRKDTYWGYHKPLMLAGGMGNIDDLHIKKKKLKENDLIIVLGGSGLLIGLGGSCQSSKELSSNENADILDYQSVQRDNAEIERRCQEVINRCTTMKENNIILMIHDVGAGGLSNAIPELVNDSGLGATIHLRKILVDDNSMSPMEIWCNESQERYVLSICQEDLETFDTICKRERCPYSVVGNITNHRRLKLYDSKNNNYCIDLEMDFLFNHAPKLICKDETDEFKIDHTKKFDVSLNEYFNEECSVGKIEPRIAECIKRVLSFPAVASKMFLITIGDRSVGGLVTQAQLVGKYQTPISDVGVAKTCFNSLIGEALSIGERPVLALIDSKASVSMAFGESLTNILSANIVELSQISVSANWMACVSHRGQLESLYKAVEHLSLEVMSQLDICIPVGKDSMSMKAEWNHENASLKVVSPVTGVITAYASVKNVNKTITPDLKLEPHISTVLVLIDLGYGKLRMGGSALSQVFGNINEEAPCFENITLVRNLNNSLNRMRDTQSFSKKHNSMLLAYHDRSDGGLITSVLEMCFASRTGATISLDKASLKEAQSFIKYPEEIIKLLFSEELGIILQIEEKDYEKMKRIFDECSYPIDNIHIIGRVNSVEKNPDFKIEIDQKVLFKASIYDLLQDWSSTSRSIQALRDGCDKYANEENDLLRDSSHPGLFYKTTFTVNNEIPRNLSRIPKIYIIREQGTNGHIEMAYAFYRAGFEPRDVHMSDIKEGRVNFRDVDLKGVAFCGGFSFGDVIGAGKGWELNLKKGNPKSYADLLELMQSKDKFVLGICNGCQLLSKFSQCNCLDGEKTSAEDNIACWPDFVRNNSRKFEARTTMVHISNANNSVFFSSMKGSYLPIVVAHGEGKATFKNNSCLEKILKNRMIALQYINNIDESTRDFENYSTNYPTNPNGSVYGIAGVSSRDGRILAIMPHPERTIFSHNMPYYPNSLKINTEIIEESPWMEMFYNARRWVG